ncbi:phosophoadenylyl-sulfate reductase [Wallemia mellicola]|uniref:Phosophoadenylyl-sulfate reductase n=2 Tax=Wallemia mellicola TaxID=1708541 RepID=A0A4V4MU27_9BASI|nr:phosophoadenylyl-sulfate reductase [Wallemia mellicola CBS 633.66]TIB67263.1 hypothetical protein E3Q24_04211 [Wallemia mellicola]EIM22532.1 phosophoadenylyl-sulfate reductase [Wallemia mellicola CBS 633.66]TIB72863.1 hypothetical protein E3Q23_03233 [Wallemia mellicola]TIB76654.1 phosophoadenylyl-sulfate reductase [Wallemia mellicola]TIB82568.1 phosophoadenylyl-sulfate reductase [Wallemia mellicola]|eukprot:XP_006957204.1 phosophoadenylyl-sulfate reductase [Wallemia mellicola CBS 633.66]
MLDQAQLQAVNEKLANATPQEILEWAIDNLDGLYQTTAFGLTGTIAVDMISKISKARGTSHSIDLIFLNTLYHFQETIDLAKAVSEKYNAKLHNYIPNGVNNVTQFEALYGKELWKTDEDMYDFAVKVEPARRAYEELGVKAVLTGRRRSQGGERAAIPAIEIDETGLIKVNPLASWTFNQVKEYADANQVPYNALLDKGYKSVGDWHSTKAPSGVSASDADERSGRWSDKGGQKTECGLHKDFFVMKRAFEKRKRELELAKKDSEAQVQVQA